MRTRHMIKNGHKTETIITVGMVHQSIRVKSALSSNLQFVFVCGVSRWKAHEYLAGQDTFGPQIKLLHNLGKIWGQ